MKGKGRQKTVMAHQFSKAPQATIQRSKFNRNHGYKSTIDSGTIYPILIDEVYPGDDVTCNLSALARLATLLHVPMDNMFLETFFFFVPNRLVWDNWQKFMGEQDNPGDSTSFLVPTLSGAVGIAEQTIYDYAGIPIGLTPDTTEVNALPFRGMNLVYNEWFRDENLQDSLTVPKDDGPDPDTTYTLFNRGKRHDYFTSCLPWPQKGPGVDLPLGDKAWVASDQGAGGFIAVETPMDAHVAKGITTGAGGLNANTTLSVGEFPNEAERLYADLSGATAGTINDLRQAFQIQKLQERDARGGTRYVELIKAHFQVTSPDHRLQRSEYLGGGRSGVHVQLVPQTSGGVDVADDTPQGNIAGFGVANVNGHGFTKGFVEHGFILGFINIRADLTYQQGLDKQWSRQTKHDYYWPAFQGLGEQAVLNKEIWVDGTIEDDTVFGYQERFAELRYKKSQITALFRSDATASLDAWHLSQDFATRPVLNDVFITDNPPIDRIIAIPGEPQFLLDCYFNYTWARPMPMYGVPGYIDHF